jgi:hypothetical protein
MPTVELHDGFVAAGCQSTLDHLKMCFPKTSPEREQELLAIRKQLEK